MEKNKLFLHKVLALAIIMAIVIFMIIYEQHLGPTKAGDVVPDGKLLETQKESLSIRLDLCKLLITWSLALLGAAGFFLKLNIEKGITLHKSDVLLSFIVILLGTVSIFFGLLFLERCSLLLAAEQFPVESSETWKLGRFQYVYFLCSIFIFGFNVFQFFWTRLNNSQSHKKESKNDM